MTATTAPTGALAEDLGTFRARAQEWVAANLEPLNGADPYLGHATDDADHRRRRDPHAVEPDLCVPADQVQAV